METKETLLIQKDKKEETVKEKILNIFLKNTHRYISYVEIRDYFGRTEKGVNAIDRFKRFLVADGHKIIKRKRENAPNTYEYKLVKREPIQSSLF